jgi:hypothetical protein
LDRGCVGLVDEHRDRPFHHPADLEHLLEHVAARVFEVDQDDVGIDLRNAGQEIRGALNAQHIGVAGLAQPPFQDGRPDRAVIDDDDLKRRMDLVLATGQAGAVSSCNPPIICASHNS